MNLALLAACVLSVQGIAVQFHVTGRLLSTWDGCVYWLVMGIFFAPLILASGVVLGLVDQWVDLTTPATVPGRRDCNEERRDVRVMPDERCSTAAGGIDKGGLRWK